MRLGELLREAIAATWAAKVPSALLLIVVSAMCVAPLITVGKLASQAAVVQDQMTREGARRLVVIDSKQAGFINSRTLSEIQRISTVQGANALSAPVDVVNGVIGVGSQPAPLWSVVGEISGVATLSQGRWPRQGEAVIARASLNALSLALPVGYLASGDGLHQWPIVGSFSPRPGFEDLATGAITPAPAEAFGRELRVTLDSISSARATTTAVLSILDPADPQGVYVESPTSIAQTAQELDHRLSGYGRSLQLAILSVGGFFVAAVVLADVLVRRKDLGRRRTLGASRADLTALVTLRVVLVGVVGAALGCASAWWLNARSGTRTPIDFTVAVGILTTLIAALATLPPAIFAARRDPVAVLRTP